MIAMLRSKIAGIGMYVHKNVVTNNDLKKYMDNSFSSVKDVLETGFVS